MHQVKIQCPAKINLTLKITGKRPDGFHNIESIMQTISLYDYLSIKLEKADSLNISLAGNSNEIPYNEKNLVYKASKLFFENYKDKNYNVNVYIEKSIPVSAGLAGGSTNAAGMLFGLNHLLNNPLSKTEIHSLAAQLGSDLNFCLEGGKQMTSGRGEVLTPMKFEKFNVSLIKPLDLGISAKEAYTRFAERNSAKDIGRKNFVNDLEWGVINDYAQLQHIKKQYPNSVMSGSGSTYYLVDENFAQENGYWVKNGLESIPSGVCVVD